MTPGPAGVTGRAITARRPQDRRTRIRRFLTAAALAVGLLLVAPVYANAHRHPTICERAYQARQTVKHRYGQAGAGRNICRFGVRTAERTKGASRRASYRERVRYLHALEALARPAPPFLAIVPGAPRVSPSGTLAVHYQPVGLARCIAYAESGNRANPGGQTAHTGVAQWDPNAWAADSGLHYAPYPTAASYDEQLLVLSYGLVHFGCRQWCPFDPC